MVKSSSDHQALRNRAEKYLFRYGHEFAPYLGVKGLGSYIYDEKGRKVLDFCSGQMCATLGHNHPDVVKAIEESTEQVIHLFSGVLSPPVLELAEKLSGLLPPNLQKIMFLSTGGESNEAALKMAKLESGGFEVLALSASWHGSTSGAGSSTYNGGRKGYGPSMPGNFAIPGPNCNRCPVQHCRDLCDMTCLEVGFNLYDQQSVGAPAAFIAEPIQSSAGIIVPPEGYFSRVKKMCEERGMRLILDEAQTGLGRTGSTFAFEAIGVEPDILTLSKTLGNGLPLSATITSEEIEIKCHQSDFLFYTSHLSDPMPAAAGVAVLSVLERENLAIMAKCSGEYFINELQNLKQRYECIGDVRGRGLLIGLEIVKDRETREPHRKLAVRFQRRCLELGLILHAVRADSQSTLRIAPPLNVSRDEIDMAVSILDEALSDCLQSISQ